MEGFMKEIIEKLKEQNKTVATMESCTGGRLASDITDISGSSEVLKFSAVTYSNEYKIKLGVSAETIDQYTVYSSEVAMEMSKAISIFANSDYGIGITGQLNRVDPCNPYGISNQVFVSIYDRDFDSYYTFDTFVDKETRELNKEFVIGLIKEEFINILNPKKYVKKN